MKIPFLPIITAFALPVFQSSAQTTNFWIGTNNAIWNDEANWSLGTVPNEPDAIASFTNSVSVSVNLTAFTATVGRIEASTGSGNLVLGDVGQSSDIIFLDATSGKPVIRTSSGTTFMYANLEGSNGFTKSGSGTLTFRFNGADHAYTGDIEIGGGTLAYQRDGSFGDPENDIIFIANSTLLNNSSGGAPVTLNAARTITINSAVTATLQNNQAAAPTIIDGEIAGPGGLVFNGSAAPFTVNGVNTYTGSTIFRNGPRVTLGFGANLSGATLFFDQGPGAVLDLGGNTQTVFNFNGNGVNSAGTTVVTNGTLVVNGTNNLFFGNGINGTIWDLAGLDGFFFDRTNRTFTVQVSTTPESATNTLRLAATGAGSNTIKAAGMTIGGAAGTSQGTSFATILQLGKANAIHAGTLFVGGFNGTGLINVVEGVDAPNLDLRGADGTSAMMTLNVGETSSGVRSGAGTVDFSNGTVDGAVTTMAVGRHISGANNGSTSTFSMGGGDLALTTLVLAQKSGVGTPVLTSIFNQRGGTVTLNTLTLGDDAGSGTPRLLPSYNLHGGTLRAATIQIGGGGFATNSVRTLAISNAVLRNVDGSDLTIASTSDTDAGRINIALAGIATFHADTGRTITTGENTRISGAGSLSKIGAGTLVIAGSNSYTGNTVVSGGVLRIDGSIDSSTLTTVEAGGTLGGTGSVAQTAIQGTIAPGASGTNGTLTVTGPLTVEGTARFRLFADGLNDALVVPAGVDLPGNVSVLIDSNYAPASGDSFDFITGALTGTPSLSLPALPPGLQWVTNSFVATGSLSITNAAAPTNNYASWLTNYPSLTGPAALGTADPDGDGFNNNLEFSFDGNPTVGTPALLTVTRSGTNAVFNWVQRKNPPGGVAYEVQVATNLATGPWTGPAAVTVSNSPIQSGILLPADYERRQFVVPASGRNFYRVKATLTE